MPLRMCWSEWEIEESEGRGRKGRVGELMKRLSAMGSGCGEVLSG